MTTSKNFTPTSRNNGERWKTATWVAAAVLVTLLVVWIFNLDKGFNQPTQPPASSETATPAPEVSEQPADSYPQTPEEEYVYSHAYSLISGVADELLTKYGEEQMKTFELSMDFSDKDYFGEQTEATAVASIENLPADLDTRAILDTVKGSFAEGTTWVLEERTELPESSEEVANYLGFSLTDSDEETNYGDFIMYVDFFQKEEGGTWVMSLNSSMYDLLPEEIRAQIEESKQGAPGSTEAPAPTEPTEEDSQ